METVALHGPRLGVGRLCAALVLPRATYYRHLEAQTPPPRPTTRSRAVGRRTPGRPCGPARAPLHGRRPGGGAREIARRGTLPLLGADHVPRARRERRSSRAP